MDNRDAVIALQSRRIAELCGQLETVTGERDMLLLELQQLRCQLELRELSALSRSVGRRRRRSGQHRAGCDRLP